MWFSKQGTPLKSPVRSKENVSLESRTQTVERKVIVPGPKLGLKTLRRGSEDSLHLSPRYTSTHRWVKVYL
jgi:hypothetical protein